MAAYSMDLRERVVAACDEGIDSRAEEYTALWGAPLGIHMGIAQGPARVGFFGSKAFRAYTALGPVMSLASRPCTRACNHRCNHRKFHRRYSPCVAPSSHGDPAVQEDQRFPRKPRPGVSGSDPKA